MLRFKHFAFLTILLLCIFLFAYAGDVQATKIELKRYSPALNGALSDYNGKKIYLMNFDNQANDTSIWYYFSPDNKFTYGGDSKIHNYFWSSFEKALVSIGMLVSNKEKPDPRAPAVLLIFKSINDTKYEVEVRIKQSVSVSFIKNYEISGGLIGQESERTPKNLERRAYDMTNRLIETILTDPEFKRAFFKAASNLAAQPSN